MSTVLIEPTDVLLSGDVFPGTLHGALRASLVRARGSTHPQQAREAFRSLRTVGPLPWHPEKGLLLPVPCDAALTSHKARLSHLQLWRDPSVDPKSLASVDDFRPLCLPVATTPPDKRGQLRGWWTVPQYQACLSGETSNSNQRFHPLPDDVLWLSEPGLGSQTDLGNCVRTRRGVRFAAQVELGEPRAEPSDVASLEWLLLGGESRLARLWHKTATNQALPDCFAELRQPPTPLTTDGPCLLKWTLITPAIFTHGNLPGWCAGVRLGEVCLNLPGRARLISWCIAEPRTVSGWDTVEGQTEPARLAVPAGGIYYFLCESRDTAAALAARLHWQPRSDFHSEKGCGYGLVSFDVQMHRTSPDVRALASELFGQ